MRKTIIALVAVAAVGFTGQAEAQHYRHHGGHPGYHHQQHHRHHGGHNGWVAGLGGLAIGTVIGGAIAQAHNPPPAYYAPPPVVYYMPPPVVPYHTGVPCYLVPRDVTRSGAVVAVPDCPRY